MTSQSFADDTRNILRDTTIETRASEKNAKAMQIQRILKILAWACDELLWGQARNGVNFDFEVKFDLEGQDHSPPKAIGILIKVFYTCDPNLVILARTGYPVDKQVIATRTDRQTQATAIPDG